MHSALLAARLVVGRGRRRWSRRGPATWAPARAGGSRGCRRARRSTPPASCGVGRWAPCGCPPPTLASGTAACPTTPSRRWAGSRWCRRTSSSRCCRGRSARRVREQAAGLGGAAPARRGAASTGCDEALAGSPVRLSTMGRGLDDDAPAFLAAAAAGRHAAPAGARRDRGGPADGAPRAPRTVAGGARAAPPSALGGRRPAAVLVARGRGGAGAAAERLVAHLGLGGPAVGASAPGSPSATLRTYLPPDTWLLKLPLYARRRGPAAGAPHPGLGRGGGAGAW